MKNWKTTLLGFATAALNLYANGAKPSQIAFSVALSALGLASKDLDVTGAGKNARKVESN